eukprot:23286_4
MYTTHKPSLTIQLFGEKLQPIEYTLKAIDSIWVFGGGSTHNRACPHWHCRADGAADVACCPPNPPASLAQSQRNHAS